MVLRLFSFWLGATVRGARGLFEGSIPRLILSISVSLTIWRTVANRKTQCKSISNVEPNLLVTINWIVISSGGTELWFAVRAWELLVKGVNWKWEAVTMGCDYRAEGFYQWWNLNSNSRIVYLTYYYEDKNWQVLSFNFKVNHPCWVYSIIIIIIRHYKPFWVSVFSAKFLQVLSLAASFQFLTSSFCRSSMTSSCHHCLGFSTGLVSIVFHSSSFLVGLAWSILWICPSHLILRALMNLTISAF